MKLADMTVTQFTDVLASSSPAPGGGSVAALEAAFGAALLTMVCRLTLSSKKCEASYDLAQKCLEKAELIQKQMIDVMDRDTEAFNVVSAAYGMPKDTDEQKAARSKAIQKGLALCCGTPLEVMEGANDALALAAELDGKYNANCSSDFGVAVDSLKAGIHGAYLNVMINVDSMKDQSLAAELRAKADALNK